MANHPEAAAPQASIEGSGSRLTREEGWALIRGAFGSATRMYAEAGGAEAFLRSERAAWSEDAHG